MKKLMIAAAIVCAAAMSHAASLDWGTWGYSLSGGTTGDEVWEGNTGAAYLVMVTDAANFVVGNDLAITGGEIVHSTLNDGTGAFNGSWNTTLDDGQKYLFAIVATTAGTGAKDINGSYIMPTTGYYGVDRNGDNTTASGFYEATWSADTGAMITAFGGTDPDYEDAFYGVGMTSAVGAVPEPTSGLLLLLGVAGLALRRRRA